MDVPNWYEVVLLALAAWRTFQLIAEDDILDRPRRYVTDRVSEKWELFIECPYCAGFWIAVAWWASWQIEDEWTLIVATPFVLSAGVIAAVRWVRSWRRIEIPPIHTGPSCGMGTGVRSFSSLLSASMARDQ